MRQFEHPHDMPAKAPLQSGRLVGRRAATKSAVAFLLVVFAAMPQAGQITGELERVIASRGTHADTSVIVRFDDSLDLRPFVVADRSTRNNALLVALRLRHARHRSSIESMLAECGASHVKDLWMVNAVAATLPAFAVRRLAAAPGIMRIELDSFVQGGRSQRMSPPRVSQGGTAARVPVLSALPLEAEPAARGGAMPPWNVTAVRAPSVWALGYTGEGIVVAIMDTGVDLAHPDLRRQWRAGANSWLDVHGEEALPYDALGHGTQAMGVMVGARGIGIAPAARWIAVRLYDSAGRASMSDIHLAFQWLLDPDGDSATIDAPDVVNASWTLGGRVAGSCTLEFDDDIRALRSAGIVVTFAAGNDGPAPASSSSPGNNPGVLSVGAVDQDLVVARQSGRGPSSCDGSVFPRVVAPGVGVRTTDLSHGGQPTYTLASGTSLAAPHAAGVLALLAGAFPHASVADLEQSLERGARVLGASGKDNLHGHGLIDALAAFKALSSADRH
jgi:serine protease AprX